MDEAQQMDRERAVLLYSWRIQDYSSTRSYRRIVHKIRNYTEQTRCTEWNGLLCSVALIETFERGTLSRAAEWAVHALTFGHSGLTLGPMQLRNAPWKMQKAIERLIYQCSQKGVTSSLKGENLGKFAQLWYGHDKIEIGSALSYPSALQIASEILHESAFLDGKRR